MSHDRWEVEEGEWETAVNHKKINRAVRRERKEQEAAQSATIGAEPEYFDVEAARRAAQTSFYGASKQQQRKPGKKRAAGGGEADLDFDDAGWTGGSGAPNAKAKKSKKPKAIVPQYTTADEIAEALVDIISRVPPTISGATATLASLGDKLATLTKKQWNKHYKSEFGTMRKFLEGRPSMFRVEGEEVSLVARGKPSGGAAKKSTKLNSASSNGDASTVHTREGESDDDEDDGANGGFPSSSHKPKTKTFRKEDGTALRSVLTVFVLLAVGIGGWIVWTGQRKA